MPPANVLTRLRYFFTLPVIVHGPYDGIGQGIHIFRFHNVSRLAVFQPQGGFAPMGRYHGFACGQVFAQLVRETIIVLFGLVFVQGDISEIQSVLDERCLGVYLVKDRATGLPAQIRDKSMQTFIRMSQISPFRLLSLTRGLRAG